MITTPALLLNLAGMRVRLVCRPETFIPAITARYQSFVDLDQREQQTDFTAELTFGDPQVSVSRFDLHVRFHDGRCLFDSIGASGDISVHDRYAELTICSSTPLESVEYFLRSIYALLTDTQGGLLLHCAGVLTDSGVHLFVGQSGSGKSTASRLSSSHAVTLNDDLIALLPQEGRWIGYGTPFWNIETVYRDGQTFGGPIVGIYKLVKDHNVYVESMSTAAAVAELYSNCPIVNADPARAPALLARCRQIAGAVPVQRLHFRQDPSFWDVLAARGGQMAESEE